MSLIGSTQNATVNEMMLDQEDIEYIGTLQLLACGANAFS